MKRAPIKKKIEKTCQRHGCEKTFIPQSIEQKWCSVKCGTIMAMEQVPGTPQHKKRARRERREFRATDEKLLHRRAGYYSKRFAKLRDRHDGCIVCGQHKDYQQWQGGHFRTVGSCRALQYHVDNIHLECIYCNMYDSTHLVQYEINLREKIGDERVDFLKNFREPFKWTVEALQERIGFYKAGIRELGFKPDRVIGEEVDY